MSAKTKEKTMARALQQETGWTYSECLRVVRLALVANTMVDAVLASEGRTRAP